MQDFADRMINHIVEWGTRLDSIRTLILTSSRATPLGTVDIFSDFDVIIVATDIKPFYETRDWLEEFGTVLALYRDPLSDQDGVLSSGYVIQFEDGLKIDFTLWQVDQLKRIVAAPELPPEFDAGYRVLLDKDALTAILKPPTYKAYIPTPPTEARYQEAVETFFLDTTYVAKFLWRDDIVAAKHLLDHFIKQEHLLPMLEWHIEIEHGWSVKTGLYGQRLKRWLRSDLWEMLECTYANADIDANWEALLQTIRLYHVVAVEVGEKLKFEYPHDLEQRTLRYLQTVKTLDRQAQSIM